MPDLTDTATAYLVVSAAGDVMSGLLEHHEARVMAGTWGWWCPAGAPYALREVLPPAPPWRPTDA